MKQIQWMVLLILLLIPTAMYAQTYEFTYGYDASGNRTGRTFSLKSATIPQKDTISSPSELSRAKQEILQDIISDHKIRIYPNPTKGMINIEIPDNENLTALILVYGIQGNLILSEKVKGTLTGIDLNNQPPGMYILKISLGDQSSDWKVIKE
jgi:hypothetical protein